MCVHPPLTDEPRISLDIGDLVNVTRWRKHWLFGEKIQNLEIIELNGKISEDEKQKTLTKKRARGWFPRQCAADFFEDGDSDSDDENEDTKKTK